MSISFIVISGVILLWLLLRLFVLTDSRAGYRCPHCRFEFQPSAWKDKLGPHVVFYRYLKCPRCRRYGWAAVIRD